MSIEVGRYMNDNVKNVKYNWIYVVELVIYECKFPAAPTCCKSQTPVVVLE